jgi:hypothetical protein
LHPNDNHVVKYRKERNRGQASVAEGEERTSLGRDPGRDPGRYPHAQSRLARASADSALTLDRMGNIGPERRRIEVLPVTAPAAPAAPQPVAPAQPITEPAREPVPVE